MSNHVTATRRTRSGNILQRLETLYTKSAQGSRQTFTPVTVQVEIDGEMKTVIGYIVEHKSTPPKQKMTRVKMQKPTLNEKNQITQMNTVAEHRADEEISARIAQESFCCCMKTSFVCALCCCTPVGSCVATSCGLFGLSKACVAENACKCFCAYSQCCGSCMSCTNPF